MILIADGGSTKTDWIALDNKKNEIFRVQTSGLNPSIITKDELKKRITNTPQLTNIKNEITKIYFYGAGCGTPKPIEALQNVMSNLFVNAKILIKEDMLAAVYASTGKKPAIVCILGTGSNSCYFNGNKAEMSANSLGYSIMDEASGNYFGRKLLRDYFYNKMPKKITESFESNYNLNVDFVKMNLYQKPNPNMYLASFAKSMLEFKNEEYIKQTIKKGFEEFFTYRVLPFNKNSETPIYFIGSIAFYFRDILEKVATNHNLKIADVIQRPIDKLLEFHKNNIN